MNTSGPECPDQVRVGAFTPQHVFPNRFDAVHGAYCRSMNGTSNDHPAPISPLCGFSAAVIPSTADDEYDSDKSGSPPAGAGTVGRG